MTLVWVSVRPSKNTSPPLPHALNQRGEREEGGEGKGEGESGKREGEGMGEERRGGNGGRGKGKEWGKRKIVEEGKREREGSEGGGIG